MNTARKSPRPEGLFPTSKAVVAAAALGALALAPASAWTMPAGATTRLSVDSDGSEANGPSYHAHQSGNARYSVFSSDASDLVPGDTNDQTDVFWHDRYTGETRRVSVDSSGVEANGRSLAGGVSGNGKLVVFWSHATNLVDSDTNGVEDVFLHDLTTRTTLRISRGLQFMDANNISRRPTISEDGRFVAYHSAASNLVSGDTNGEADIFLYEVKTKTTTRIGQPAGAESNGDSSDARLSKNGRWVAFESHASNLVPGDTNDWIDSFLLDRKDGTLTRVSVSSEGVEGDGQSRAPRVSATGRYVTFYSLATNLVPNDTNDAFDAFVYDRKTGETERVSVASDGTQGSASSYSGGISANGRYVLITSWAPEFATGDDNETTDVFVHDRKRKTTTRVEALPNGAFSEAQTWGSGLSRNGRYVLLGTAASGLVPADTNGTDDVFLHRWR